MIICGIISSLAEVLTVLAIIIGFIVVLVCLHCGSDYLIRRTHSDSSGAKREADILRRESEERNGITRHSLFYGFFFRGD